MAPFSKSLIFMGIGIIFMVMMDALIKYLGATLAILQVVWLRSLFGMLPLMGFVLFKRNLNLLSTGKPAFHIIRGGLGVVALGAFALGLRDMTIANANAIVFSAPFFMVLFSAILIGEKIGRHRYIAMIIGFIGVLVVIRPDEGIFGTGVQYMVLCAMAYALSQVLTRKYALTESALCMTFWTSCTMVVLTSIPLYAMWVEMTSSQWGLAIIMGGCGAAGHLMMTQAARLGPPSALAPMEYTALIWAAIIDVLVWSVWPSLSLLAGSVIIVFSGIYIFWRENKIKKQLIDQGAL